MTGYSYAIGSENGTGKIGYSVNQKSRLRREPYPLPLKRSRE